MNNDSRKIWENIFQLSQAVFRVTHLFPKDEILRRHLREKVTEILYQSSQNFGGKNHENLTKEIHDFRSYLFTAKNCNFVDEKNLIILIKECENLLEKLDNLFLCRPQDIACHSRESGNPDSEFPKDQIFIPQSPISFPRRREPKPSPTSIRQLADQLPTSVSNQSDIGFFLPNHRQQKILDYFKKNNKEKIRLKDVADEFRNISPRTVRGDLRDLCDNGHIVRNGIGAGSFYHLPNNAS